MESEAVQEHVSCPDCGSSDALVIYSDNHSYCFSCRVRRNLNGKVTGTSVAREKHQQSLLPVETLTLGPLRARGITADTCKKYGYYTADHKGKPVQVACYFDDAGELTGQKIRWKDKEFRFFGAAIDRFCGQNLFTGGKKLVITEGEIDMLTASQAQQNKYPVVSLPFGAGSAKKTFLAQLEWLEKFEEVITMFDMDGPGEEARKSVGGLLSPGKLKHARLPMKDPNECLLAGKSDEIVRAVWNATPWRPDGIINGAEMWDKLNEPVENSGLELPWNIELNRMTAGIRTGELVLFTAGSGIGKTTMVRAIAHHLGTAKGLKVGMLCLEEQPKRTAQGLMSITAGHRLHMDWLKTPKEDLKKAFDETLGTGNFVIYDHFGSVEGDNLIQQMRYMAVAEGCKFLVLDHISIAVSGIEGPDERRIIDVLMTKLAALTQETGCGILVISHLRKTDGKGKTYETGRQVTLDDLRGSGALAQLAFTVIALERNQQDEDPIQKNVVQVRLLKCRFTGETGLAGQLYYDKETDRLGEVPTFPCEESDGETGTDY